MRETKILSLVNPENYLQRELMNANGVENIQIYREAKSFYEKIIRRICQTLNLTYAYSKNLRECDLAGYNLVIIHEPLFPEKVVKYIRGRNFRCHILLVMWNTLKYAGSPKLYNKKDHFSKLLNNRGKYHYEVVSFDQEDSRRYGMTFNNQFTFICDSNDDGDKPDDGVFFCGRDKNRIGMAMTLGKWLKEENIHFNCWMIPEINKTYTSEEQDFLKNGWARSL